MIPDEEWGVHNSHCCEFHGCKYGDETNCPVVTQVTKQLYMCDECHSLEQEDKRFGIYKHFKGKMYELYDIVMDSTSMEKVAIYRDSNGNKWCRPWKEFDDIHPVHNIKRFQKL
jgi:hypothetical protein